VSEPVDLNYVQHTVLLQYLDIVELRNWLSGGRPKTLTLGRVTFERTAQNSVFVSTLPDPTRATPVFRQKEIEDDED
jgi:hypothetical protein